MRKFFILCLMAFVICVNANAQNVWEVDYVPVDELTSDGGYYFYYYENEELNSLFFATKHDFVVISTFKGWFDYEDNRISVLIGYYQDGTLIEKETKYFIKGNSDSAMLIGKSKIVNHLRNVGDIRIVTKQHNYYNFDLTIPMFPRLE